MCTFARSRAYYRVSTRLQEWKWECRNVAMHDFANSRGGRVKVKLEYVIEGSILFFFGAMTKLNLFGKN